MLSPQKYRRNFLKKLLQLRFSFSRISPRSTRRIEQRTASHLLTANPVSVVHTGTGPECRENLASRLRSFFCQFPGLGALFSFKSSKAFFSRPLSLLLIRRLRFSSLATADLRVLQLFLAFSSVRPFFSREGSNVARARLPQATSPLCGPFGLDCLILKSADFRPLAFLYSYPYTINCLLPPHRPQVLAPRGSYSKISKDFSQFSGLSLVKALILLWQ